MESILMIRIMKILMMNKYPTEAHMGVGFRVSPCQAKEDPPPVVKSLEDRIIVPWLVDSPPQRMRRHERIITRISRGSNKCGVGVILKGVVITHHHPTTDRKNHIKL